MIGRRADECVSGCRYALDVSMPEHECADECQYLTRQSFVPCDVCGGSGDSGEVEILDAPATWDDPGYHEENPVPCWHCGGTGRVEQVSHPLQPLIDRLDQLAGMMKQPVDDDLPF
jgi:hypothetical protein